jgi:hypothetical protein
MPRNAGIRLAGWRGQPAERDSAKTGVTGGAATPADCDPAFVEEEAQLMAERALRARTAVVPDAHTLIGRVEVVAQELHVLAAHPQCRPWRQADDPLIAVAGGQLGEALVG